MSEEEKKLFAPLLPFSGHLNNNFIIYDNVPYTHDHDLCESNIRKTSGNLIKYYTVNNIEEKATIPIA